MILRSSNYALLMCAVLCALPAAVGQLLFNADPTVNWSARGDPVRQGNGVFLSPDEDLVISSSDTGTIVAWDSFDGTEMWRFTPAAGDGSVLSCSSGLTFIETGSMQFMIYAVIVNGISPNPMSFVTALSMIGEELWTSPMLEGEASGTPVASGDAGYIFLTHNSNDGTKGHFTILGGQTGEVFFTQLNDEDAPFAPPGIHHSPAEGYYEGGEFNTNDILVWSVQPKPEDETVGPGMTFAFQFPATFSGESSGLSYIILASNVHGTEVRDFQASQKPVFANEGRSMYWGTSRSQFRCWIGEAGLNRYRFDRPRTNTVGFARGNPARLAVHAPLALTNNRTNLLLFGGSAARQFVRLNADFTDEVVIATAAIVTTQAHVSPDDLYVYYVEFGGLLHQASTEDLMDNWIFNIQVPVQGEFALRTDGTVLYVADIGGTVQALQVAELPSESPSSAPSQTPSESPSKLPTSKPSSMPTASPTVATPIPTMAPVSPKPTPEPTLGPTSAPVSDPTLQPGESRDGDSEEVASDVEFSERSGCSNSALLLLAIASMLVTVAMV